MEEKRTDEDLIRALRAGDTDAEEELYIRYKPVVRSKARAYFLVGGDREDLIQEGMIGLYRAVCDFSFERETSFRSFADLCITRQMISAVKAATRKKHIPLNTYISLNEPLWEEDTDQTLIDVLSGIAVSDPERTLLDRESAAAATADLDQRLTQLEKQVLSRYLAGQSYRQIAAELERSEKSIDNALQRIKKKLEERLNAR